MMIRGSRLRQIGWAVVLAICMTAFGALTFRVNAVKSEVRLAERKIIALQKEKLVLETEFETRANQQQLADWNRIEFGYQAPKADQYLENERQLASLGLPRGLNAPEPIRVARADTETEAAAEGFPTLISPLTGGVFDRDAGADRNGDQRDAEMSSGKPVLSTGKQRRSLSDRLSSDSVLTGQLAAVSE